LTITVPPLSIDPDLAKALSALRAGRERQGLSLSDVSERSGIDRATLSTPERRDQVANQRKLP
jgi:transcriptional regulator with XRE-family HTH domain